MLLGSNRDGNLTRLCFGLLGDDHAQDAIGHRGLQFFGVDAFGQGEDALEGAVFALSEVAALVLLVLHCFAPAGDAKLVCRERDLQVLLLDTGKIRTEDQLADGLVHIETWRETLLGRGRQIGSSPGRPSPKFAHGENWIPGPVVGAAPWGNI